ncbi:MAG: hypothetical protein HY059_11800 [Proteobacteria bacterium]|nr:hypothetical protein [Pseudomonadota bacterium]
MRTLEQIDRRIAEIKRALTQLGPLRPGSISRQYNICGTPGCRCKADPPEKHGPYHQLNFTWRGRSHTEFVREQDLAEAAAELDSYQQLRSLNEEWIALGIERARLRRDLRKPKSTAKSRDEKRPSLNNRRRATRK